MTCPRLIVAVTLAAWIGAAHADWIAVAEQSRLEFEARYEGQAVPGTFHRFEAEVGVAPRTDAPSRLAVTVDLASADMFSTDINTEILGPAWFDVIGMREAVFESGRIEPRNAGAWVAHGTLTLRGAARAVEVPFTWRAQGDGGMLEGETTLDRTAFGIGMGEWEHGPIAADIVVRYHVVLRRE